MDRALLLFGMAYLELLIVGAILAWRILRHVRAIREGLQGKTLN